MFRTLFTLGLFILLGLSSAYAKPLVATAPHIGDRTINLDGFANEAVWKSAAALNGFSVYRPRAGIPPRFKANARVLRDKEALYVLVRVGIPKADVFAPLIKRDGSPDGDRVSIIIDSLATGQQGYLFITGAGGYLSDGLMTVQTGNVDVAWDSLFDAKTQQDDEGWTAEIRIPFQSLRFTDATDTWGLHILVEGWKHQQTLSWVPIDRDKTNFVGQAAPLQGIEGAIPGRAFELLPALTVGWAQEADGPKPSCSFGAGFGQFEVCGANIATSLSGKWAITPSLTMDVSMFPDFSQLGADAAQLTVNNRYALYLPERRPFFVEGKEIFDISIEGFDDDFALFYSRSIGRPEAAIKLSGTVGSTRVGALVAWDSAPADSILDDEFSEESLADEEKGKVQSLVNMVRGQQLFGSDGNVGVMILDKEVFVDNERRAYNQVVGLDSTLFLTEQLRLETAAYYSHANSLLDTELNGYAVHSRGVYKEDDFRIQGHYRHISDDFRSEAGYVPRVNVHELFLKYDWYHRSEDFWARKISPGIWIQGFLDDKGIVEERKLGANTYWELGERMWLFGRYDRAAERVDGAWLDGNRYYISGGIGPLKLVYFKFGLGLGDTIVREDLLEANEEAYIGSTLAPSVEFSLRPLPQWTLSARYTQRMVWNTESDLSDQNIFRLSTRYFLRADLDLLYVFEWQRVRNYVDGDSTDRMRNEVFLSWEPEPGKILFIGYTETTDLEPTLAMEDRQAFLKFNWLFTL